MEGAVVAGLSGESGREGVDREEEAASWEVGEGELSGFWMDCLFERRKEGKEGGS